MSQADPHIKEMAAHISRHLGLHFSPRQGEALSRSLKVAAGGLGIDSRPEAMIAWLSQPELALHELDMLAQHLTIGETYFFREKTALKLFSSLLPHESRKRANGQRPRLRIWSAGCSSGEEPYSLAILLQRHLHDLKDWDIQITATDISPAALAKARSGRYTRWSFRETPEDIKHEYFRAEDGHWIIREDIREMVHFARLNLSTGNYPSLATQTHEMDIIFCRNVLMYLSPESVVRATDRFLQALRPGGYLITSQVELNEIWFSAYKRMVFENGIFYQKPLHNESKEKKSVLLPDSEVPEVSPAVKRRVIRTSSSPSAQASVRRPKTLSRTAVSTGVKSKAVVSDKGEDLHQKVRNLADQGCFSEASELIESLLESEGMQAELLYLHALILSELREWERADARLVQVLYLEPSHLGARLSRHRVFQQRGMPVQAERELRQLLSEIEKYHDEAVLPGLDGITAGRIRQLA